MESTSPISTFYVKVRGKQLGPLSAARIRELVKQGQVNRATPVSTDGRTWQKAGEIDEIFTAAKDPENKPAGVGAGPKWYYSIGGARNGPVELWQIEQMLKSGTLSSASLVWRQGMSDWQPASVVPELTEALNATTPADPLGDLGSFTPPTNTPVQNPFWQQPSGVASQKYRGNANQKFVVQDDEDTQYAKSRVRGPALAIQIYTAILLVFLVVWLVLIFLGFSVAMAQNLNSYIPNEDEQIGLVFGATFYGIQAGIALVLGILVYYGASQMRKLRSYGFAMTAAILGMIPCVSPCCLLGLPFGIWAIVVLSDPRVKQSFS